MKQSLIKTAKTTELAIEEGLKELGKSREDVEIEVVKEEQSGLFGLIGQKDAVVKLIYEEELDDISFEQVKEDKEEKTEEIETTQEGEEKDLNKVKPDRDNSERQNEESQEKKEESKNPSLEENDDKQGLYIEKYYKAKDFLTAILKEMHLDDVRVVGNLEDNIIKLDAFVNEDDTGIAIGRNGRTIDAIEKVVRKAIGSRRNDLKVNIDINDYKKRRDDAVIRQADEAARRVQKTKKPRNLKYMNSYERRLAHTQIAKYENLESHSEGLEPRRYVVVEYKDF